MKYWWVNQNQTFKHEVRGSFMWSPKHRADGTRNQFYEYMRGVSPGDIVFSFCDTRIKAIGIVSGRAQTGPKPDFGAAGANWSQDGWFVPVDYCRLDNEIRPKDHMAVLGAFLPAKYSPLLPNGNGLQSVYLTEVPELLADALIGLIGDAFWAARNEIAHAQNPLTAELDDIEAEKLVVGPTLREQVVRARRGQGVFRSNVLLREDYCRVTRSVNHAIWWPVTSSRGAPAPTQSVSTATTDCCCLLTSTICLTTATSRSPPTDGS